MTDYLRWNQQTITDFSDENVNALYDKGYVFTRVNKGVMDQTRSVRIDLKKFELSSENRRILRKTEEVSFAVVPLPYTDYDWKIGKLAKDFYDTKFGEGVFSANKIKELLTDSDKSNFNRLFVYAQSSGPVGYAICTETDALLHYSYPFYDLNTANANIGMGMMQKAILWAKENGKKYIYLGSFQRPGDIYKLQFSELEWFDGTQWNQSIDALKELAQTEIL